MPLQTMDARLRRGATGDQRQEAPDGCYDGRYRRACMVVRRLFTAVLVSRSKLGSMTGVIQILGENDQEISREVFVGTPRELTERLAAIAAEGHLFHWLRNDAPEPRQAHC